VVSTIWPFWQARTKQKPRWPSANLQWRGQRVHWI